MTKDTDTKYPIRIFMFRVWIDDFETLLSFAHSNNWDRAVIVMQLSRLYPDAKTFKLFDGVKEIHWDNNEKDINDIIDKLNYPEKYEEDNKV